MTVIIVLLALATVTVIFLVGQHKNNERIKANIEKSEERIEILSDKVLEFYESDLKDYLVFNIKEENINKIKKELKDNAVKNSKYKGRRSDLKRRSENLYDRQDEVDEELKKIEGKLEIQKQVNKWFKSNEVINGNYTNSELPIIGKLTQKSINMVIGKMNKFDTNDDWVSSLDILLVEAKSQLEQKELAQQKVKETYNKGKVREDITRSEYEAAKNEVEEIKNEEVKEALNKKLLKVLEYVEENENNTNNITKIELEKHILVLYMKLYDVKTKDQGKYTCNINEDKKSGEINYYSDNNSKVKLKAKIDIDKSGDIKYYEDENSSTEDFKERTGNIFKDITEESLLKVRDLVSETEKPIKTKEEFYNFISKHDKNIKDSGINGVFLLEPKKENSSDSVDREFDFIVGIRDENLSYGLKENNIYKWKSGIFGKKWKEDNNLSSKLYKEY